MRYIKLETKKVSKAEHMTMRVLRGENYRAIIMRSKALKGLV